MEPVITAIGAIVLTAVLESAGPAELPVWRFFAATAGAALIAAGVGRFLLARVAPRRFGRAATILVLALDAAVLWRFPFRASGTPWPELAGLASLLPAIAIYAAAAAATYGRVGRPHGFRRGEWLAPRLFLIPFVPPAAVMLAGASLGYFPSAGAFLAAYPAADVAAAAVAVAAMLVAGPPVLRRIFPSSPLTGPAAERLRALATRARVGVRAIVVWRTGARGVVNACVAGVIPQTRYIFVTDGLLAALEPEEVEAVFAHEVSHVRCHHFALLFMLVFGAFGVFSAALGAVPQEAEALALPFGVCFWGAFLIGPFAWVSRILELEADLRALDLGADPMGLVRALDKLRSFAPRRRRGHSWRHYSIPYRIRAILDFLESASARRRFARAKKGALAVVCGIFAAGAALFFLSGTAGSAAPPEIRAAQSLLADAPRWPDLYGRAERGVRDFLAARGIDEDVLAGRSTTVACPPEEMASALEALRLLAEARAGAKKEPSWLASFTAVRCLAGGGAPLARVCALEGAGATPEALAEAERELRAHLLEAQLGWDGLEWIELDAGESSPELAGAYARAYARYAGFRLLAEICLARGDEATAARAAAKALECLSYR
jgi:Zn-dependent protease with chaperone function